MPRKLPCTKSDCLTICIDAGVAPTLRMGLNRSRRNRFGVSLSLASISRIVSSLSRLYFAIINSGFYKYVLLEIRCFIIRRTSLNSPRRPAVACTAEYGIRRNCLCVAACHVKYVAVTTGPARYDRLRSFQARRAFPRPYQTRCFQRSGNELRWA